MTSTPSQPDRSLPVAPGQEEALDPANQSLAEALRKSFGILKLLMLVLVVLYFLSGWFSVKPHEQGLVLRYGRIVGAAPGQPTEAAVLRPGWHWSWPYPFERWITVPTSERELPVEFMFQLSDQEKATGIAGPKYNALSPLRDDYLITGDVNILHASLIIKYRITDAVNYVTYVHPMPAPLAGPRSPAFERYPEYTILSSLARDAVIECAAREEALVIRGSKQDEFLLAVARGINQKLDELAQAGTPLGISVDPNTGVLAPKSSTVEAILPPRQVQEDFDKVFSAQTEMASTITKARSEARERKLQAAGPDFAPLAEAISKEYDLLTKLISTESAKGSTEDLQKQYDAQRVQVEALLEKASGSVQGIIKGAMIQRDQVVKEAAGDWEQFKSLLPEYQRNPEIFISRLRDETYARALDNPEIAKMWVSKDRDGKIWLRIPRSSDMPAAARDKRDDHDLGAGQPRKKKPELVMP
ncbi:MAG TPA: SPFH domain-containing protein [Phycisphaerae bacterium]|nr:SPFH domain-containing protein [Phycisphaerae bacterium]